MSSGRPGDEHVRDWAALHLTEAPGRFVGGWLRATAAVARPLARAGVSPHAVTLLALLCALSAVPLAAIDGWAGPAAAAVAVTVSGLLDALDGAVAVQAGRTSRVGFVLDSVLDRLADAALPAALAVVAAEGTWVAAGAVAACWWLEYIRARASLAMVGTGESTKQVITPGERPTRIVLTVVGLAIPALALAALWASVIIVGASALFLLAHSLIRLHRLDPPPDPTRPTAGSGE